MKSKKAKKRQGKVTLTLPQWILLGTTYIGMIWILAQPDEVIAGWRRKLDTENLKRLFRPKTEEQAR